VISAEALEDTSKTNLTAFLEAQGYKLASVAHITLFFSGKTDIHSHPALQHVCRRWCRRADVAAALRLGRTRPRQPDLLPQGNLQLPDAQRFEFC
jgi:hypothetical protein